MQPTLSPLASQALIGQVSKQGSMAFQVEGWDEVLATIKRKEAPLREGEEKNGTEKDKGQW